ncbi:hypothetical protein [uncultured Sphingomonas sp.]|uniref:hypothetical protein n=1 Tax=uncultured Sphingomonas sp. TaxID=158754 RepID=UPI0025F0D14D|nr:hypothetical protein [uncultured Sphingomonas sp.]
MKNDDKIVAVAFLTQQGVEVLGEHLGRVYPVEGLEGLEDLLARLDEVEPVPVPTSLSRDAGTRHE